MGRLLLPVVVLLAVAAGLLTVNAVGTPYTVSAVLPAATNLIEGGPVMIEGDEAGSITGIEPMDGRARVTIALDAEYAPLNDGAVLHVAWKAMLGERLLTVADGPADNAEIPDGGMIPGAMPAPVEVDAVLAALDPPTREKLNSLVRGLRGTLEGSERDVNETVRSAGPALQAMGAVLRGLGTDGEAIRQMAVQLNATMGILAERDQDLEQVVQGLGEMTASTVGHREQLGQMLRRLPATLDQANTTLGNVPETVDEAMPLLDDLAAATDPLPSVAANLRPVLTDLRPAVRELRPTMVALAELLHHTPALLDGGRTTLPAVNEAFLAATPALDTLRPYTPELAGWLTNWNSAAANYDANGHYQRIFVQNGPESLNTNPGIASPGVTKTETPLPGQPVGQPWSDAFGSGMR
jgi:phospholipid/cholesterol/gamma-HCH transport system substrate-binding protein